MWQFKYLAIVNSISQNKQEHIVVDFQHWPQTNWNAANLSDSKAIEAINFPPKYVNEST